MDRTRRRTPRGLGATVVGVMAVLVVLVLVPAVASAKAVTPSLEIGPLKAARGYSLDLFVGSCAGKSTDVTVTYSKGRATDSIEYTYDGKGSCSASGNLKKADLTVSWPGIAAINLKVHRAGAFAKSKAGGGCTAGKGGGREDVMRGSISLSVAKALGTLKSRVAKADVEKVTDYRCKSAPKPAKTTALFAQFGTNSTLSANVKTKKVPGSVFFDDSFTPATGVTGSMFLDIVASKKVYNLSKGTATLTDVGPFASGSMTLTELPACVGSPAASHNVTISGGIIVNSPVLGAVHFDTTDVSRASIELGSAFPGDCNGYGSTPFSASIDNSCSDASGPCSIGFGENDVSFDDTSSPGTQTIVSESINYGDGSAPVAVTSDSIPDHTYAAAGTYTATVTFQTSDGNTETATTPVYITS